MPKFIEMPKLSDTMTEGTLAKWTVKEGDKVTVGKAIADIETPAPLGVPKTSATTAATPATITTRRNCITATS